MLAASMFWQWVHELWPLQTLRGEAVQSGGTAITNWDNLPSLTCQSLFKQSIISVSQEGSAWVAFCYCWVEMVPVPLLAMPSSALLLLLTQRSELRGSGYGQILDKGGFGQRHVKCPHFLLWKEKRKKKNKTTDINYGWFVSTTAYLANAGWCLKIYKETCWLGKIKCHDVP